MKGEIIQPNPDRREAPSLVTTMPVLAVDVPVMRLAARINQLNMSIVGVPGDVVNFGSGAVELGREHYYVQLTPGQKATIPDRFYADFEGLRKIINK